MAPSSNWITVLRAQALQNGRSKSAPFARYAALICIILLKLICAYSIFFLFFGRPHRVAPKHADQVQQMRV